LLQVRPSSCIIALCLLQVDFLAGLLGLKKVGWIFAQSTQPREFIMSTAEILQMAAMQVGVATVCMLTPPLHGGDSAVTVQ
jgi:hypothetical protein